MGCGGNRLTNGMWKRLKYLILPLPQSLIVEVLQVLSPLSLKTGMGTIMKPPPSGGTNQWDKRLQTNPGGNGLQSLIPLRTTQVFGAQWDPSKDTEGAGRSAHQAIFHHLSAALMGRCPCWQEARKYNARKAERRIRRVTGLTV